LRDKPPEKPAPGVRVSRQAHDKGAKIGQIITYETLHGGENMAVEAENKEKSWQSLTPDEKLERRLAAWLSADGIEFASNQAEKDYKARAKRYAEAMLLKVPDRVPVVSNLSGFAAAYYGYTAKDIMYDVDKAVDVTLRATQEFQLDTKVSAGSSAGLVCDTMDVTMYSWPGHGLPDNEGLQFRDVEYMKAGEYDALIKDPSDYWQRVQFPRMMGALAPLTALRPVLHTYDFDSVRTGVSAYGRPDVQAAMRKLMEAGNQARIWDEKMGAAGKKLDGLGFPGMTGGGSRMPFDHIGDYLRGTREIMMDMFRRPEKLKEAMERFVPLLVEMGMYGIKMGDCPIVTFPVHKGSDEFLSDSQYREFYWPTCRKVMDALFNEGLMVRMFAEGRHNSRLEFLRDELPKGKTIWYFDYTTDMAKAKATLGKVACIMGNVPVALLTTGTPEQTTEYCKKLIDVAGKGGGFIFSTGAAVDRNGKIENVRAMIKCAKEYGVYS
jgi:hypothetical protein